MISCCSFKALLKTSFQDAFKEYQLIIYIFFISVRSGRSVVVLNIFVRLVRLVVEIKKGYLWLNK